MGKVAVVQMVSSSKISDNLIRVNNLLLQASQRNVELVLLPENFACMSMSPKDILDVAEEKGNGMIQDRVSKMAARYKLWIIAGSIPIKSPKKDKVYASSMVFNSEGERVAHYNKIHLFDVSVLNKEVHRESDFISPGYELKTIDTPVGKVGLSICYDIRFPELYRDLIKQNVDIFTIPSAFTHITGRAHWEVLVRARAIENLCYVLGANQGGQHENGRETYGHSMIVSPWGEKLAECKDDKASMIYSDINLDKMYKTRECFSSLNHRVL